jgi:hypothetical protein
MPWTILRDSDMGRGAAKPHVALKLPAPFTRQIIQTDRRLIQGHAGVDPVRSREAGQCLRQQVESLQGDFE